MAAAAAPASGSGLTRRLATPAAAGVARPPPGPGGAPHPDIEPAPKPPRLLQLVAFAAIAVLAALQFLPATHFRDLFDPNRSWTPFDAGISSDSSPTGSMSSDEEQHVAAMHIYSSLDCIDLRALAVLANSTVSNTRYAEKIHQHFIVPDSEDIELSYYKMKVILPRAKIEIIGHKAIEERIITSTPRDQVSWSKKHEIVPFLVPTIVSSASKYLYVSPYTIVKGNIEELFDVDLGPHAIAASEDCSTRLGDNVDMGILNAIQRTSARSWVSKEPYDKDACTPNFDLLLVDPRRLPTNLMEVIEWWTKVLDLGNERTNKFNPAVALAIYKNYRKLPPTWNPCGSAPCESENEAKLVRYDGPRMACTEVTNPHRSSVSLHEWRRYLSSESEAVLIH